MPSHVQGSVALVQLERMVAPLLRLSLNWSRAARSLRARQSGSEVMLLSPFMNTGDEGTCNAQKKGCLAPHVLRGKVPSHRLLT